MVELAADINATKVNFVADSMQAVEWITKEAIDEHFLPNELLSCRSVIRTFQDWNLTWMTRGSNNVANDLAREARRTSRNVFLANPIEIHPFVSQGAREELLPSLRGTYQSKASHSSICCFSSSNHGCPENNESFCIGYPNCRLHANSSNAYKDV